MCDGQLLDRSPERYGRLDCEWKEGEPPENVGSVEFGEESEIAEGVWSMLRDGPPPNRIVPDRSLAFGMICPGVAGAEYRRWRKGCFR